MAKGLEQLLPMHPTGTGVLRSILLCSIVNGVAAAITAAPIMLLAKWVF